MYGSMECISLVHFGEVLVKPGFYPREFHVEFMVDKRQISLQVLRFSHRSSAHIITSGWYNVHLGPQNSISLPPVIIVAIAHTFSYQICSFCETDEDDIKVTAMNFKIISATHCTYVFICLKCKEISVFLDMIQLFF
jgi:hypothetical protein